MDADENTCSLFLMALINLTHPCLSFQEVHMEETLPSLVNQGLFFFFLLQESKGSKTIDFAALGRSLLGLSPLFKKLRLYIWMDWKLGWPQENQSNLVVLIWHHQTAFDGEIHWSSSQFLLLDCTQQHTDGKGSGECVSRAYSVFLTQHRLKMHWGDLTQKNLYFLQLKEN